MNQSLDPRVLNVTDHDLEPSSDLLVTSSSDIPTLQGYFHGLKASRSSDRDRLLSLTLVKTNHAKETWSTVTGVATILRGPHNRSMQSKWDGVQLHQALFAIQEPVLRGASFREKNWIFFFDVHSHSFHFSVCVTPMKLEIMSAKFC